MMQTHILSEKEDAYVRYGFMVMIASYFLTLIIMSRKCET